MSAFPLHWPTTYFNSPLSVIICTFIHLKTILNVQKNTKQANKENEETTCSANKTDVISVVSMKGAETIEENNKLAGVAKLVAWYVNPLIYVLFSVIYFIIGLAY